MRHNHLRNRNLLPIAVQQRGFTAPQAVAHGQRNRLVHDQRAHPGRMSLCKGISLNHFAFRKTEHFPPRPVEVNHLPVGIHYADQVRRSLDNRVQAFFRRLGPPPRLAQFALLQRVGHSRAKPGKPVL